MTAGATVGATVQTRCPGCAEPLTAPVGAAVACTSCGAWCWAIAHRDAGEPLTGVADDRIGVLRTCGSAATAAGVLAAFGVLLALEVWGLLRLVGWATD